MKKIFLSSPFIFTLTIIIVVILLFLPTTINLPKQTEETVLTGTITTISGSHVTQFEQREYIQQDVLVKAKSLTIPVSTSLLLMDSPQLYSKGDKVLVGRITDQTGSNAYYLIGYDRSQILLFLGFLFLLAVLLIGKSKGLKALFSMIFSFVVIFKLILPLIFNGHSPLLISIIGVSIIVPFSFVLTHGTTKKSLSAMISTLLSLLLIGILTVIAVYSAHLTGASTEEIETLFFISKGAYDLSSLLIAGIIIGALGILDDVTITQASVVHELIQSKQKYSRAELFHRAMRVGRDHIGSVINTLILVYTGAFLSTLLLFLTFPRPLIVLLNNETVVIQLVIALVGSIGLILAVPITTFISINIYFFYKRS